MTGLIGLGKIFVITAIAASGLMVAGTQFDAARPAAFSSETSAGTEIEGQTSTSIDADASAEAGATISADTDCLDSCPAPCATACADPQGPALDGAVQLDAALDAAVAPEPPCVCSNADANIAVSAGTHAGAEDGASTTDLGASAGAFATFGSAGN